MNLKQRVDRLQKSLAPTPRRPPPSRPEDRARALEMWKRAYSDPVRYAKRIELYERCAAKIAAEDSGTR